MNLFFVVCVACVVGLFTVSHSIALTSVFDFYFYLLPFGMALVGLFLSAGIARLPSPASVSTGILPAFSIFGAFAMLACVLVYLYAASLGPSLFVLLVIIIQLSAYIFFWSVIVRERHLALSAIGIVAGLALGYLFISYLNMDPLVAILIACVFSAALYVAQLLKRVQRVAYILIVGFIAFAVFQGKHYQVMPTSMGWILDYGKAGPENIVDRNAGTKIWGPAGMSEMYPLSSDERAAWLYTNGSSAALVLTGELASYDNAWWEQKAPLAMAIHDAVQPKSIIDIGIAPSDMAWRAIGRDVRSLYGLYGSHDWSLMPVRGIELIRKSVVLLQQPVLNAEEKIKLPVDMIVLSSGHEGKEGWVSSNLGEQRFLNQESILSYWQTLDEDGVLVLLSRQESVFLRQFFSVWTALNNAGMSDAEFLDRAWSVVPDTASVESPYRYAFVLTKKARDGKFAQALRSQVLKLPVRYLFGYGLPPSSPYEVFYQKDMNNVHGIFTLAASRKYGKHVTLDPSHLHKSIPYQFVKDVFPQYKNMLVLSVSILIGIILFPLQKFRRIENIQSLHGPSVAVWMVTGGATGILMVVALAFLFVYPSGVTQEIRLLYLGILLSIASLMHLYKKSSSITRQTTRLLMFASALVLMIYLATRYIQITVDDSTLYLGAAGILFVTLGITLPGMQSSLMRDSEPPLTWWWFAMAAGAAAALFWSMRLYAVLGDSLLFFAGLLVLCIAGVFWWHARSLNGEIRERGAAEVNSVI